MAAKLTSRQIVEISDLLKQHIRKLPDGLVEYTNGMTDKKLSQLAGVGYWQVLNIRRQVYGDMHRSVKDADKENKENLQGQITDLQRRLDAIEKHMVEDWGYELLSK